MTAAAPARRAHIAMFSIPAPGHIFPSLEVIRELVARGHRVTYAIPESFADTVAGTGAEPKTYSSLLSVEQEWGEEYLDQVEPFLEDNIRMLPQLAEAYAGDEPDLVLFDIAPFCARILARRWQVPAVQLSPCMVGWKGLEEVVAQQEKDLRDSERGRAYLDRFQGWLDANCFTGFTPLRFMASPGRTLALIPRAMQPNAGLVDTDVATFVGACQGTRAHQEEWVRPAAATGKRLLLVSLGSSYTDEPEFYRACVRAFGDLPDWYVVLQTGSRVSAGQLVDEGEKLPGNIETHSWVPQLSILRQADAFITHAGMGGSQEGLANAVPMVAVPQGADQFGNAELLAGLGVARHLPKAGASAEALRAAVLDLAGDPEVAARLREIRRGMAAEGGTPHAADLIEAELPAAP
jgi:macrolide glycosyltransferase